MQNVVNTLVCLVPEKFPAVLGVLSSKERNITRNKCWLFGVPGVEWLDIDCALGINRLAHLLSV